MAYLESPNKKRSGEITASYNVRLAMSVTKPGDRRRYRTTLDALDCWASGLRSGFDSPPSKPFDGTL
jgi:hypothetical protein